MEECEVLKVSNTNKNGGPNNLYKQNGPCLTLDQPNMCKQRNLNRSILSRNKKHNFVLP